jgi:hypothetical protein
MKTRDSRRGGVGGPALTGARAPLLPCRAAHRGAGMVRRTVQRKLIVVQSNQVLSMG